MDKITYFSFLPLIKIKGKSEFRVESRVAEKIIVSGANIKFKLKPHVSITKDINMIEFNSNFIHKFNGSGSANYPLELMNFASIDILEDICKQFDLETILFKEKDLNKTHLVELFYSLGKKVYLPFQVRRFSTRDLFQNLFQLVPVTSQLLIPLELMGDQYEDYIDNALASFIHNVFQPMLTSSNLNVAQLVKRIEELTIIINTHVDHIRDRSFQFNRLILPIVHYVKLKKLMSDAIVIDSVSKNSISYSINTTKEIKAEDLAYFLSKYIE